MHCSTRTDPGAASTNACNIESPISSAAGLLSLAADEIIGHSSLKIKSLVPSCTSTRALISLYALMRTLQFLSKNLTARGRLSSFSSSKDGISSAFEESRGPSAFNVTSAVAAVRIGGLVVRLIASYACTFILVAAARAGTGGLIGRLLVFSAGMVSLKGECIAASAI